MLKASYTKSVIKTRVSHDLARFYDEEKGGEGRSSTSLVQITVIVAYTET
jgi:hypothetical protein